MNCILMAFSKVTNLTTDELIRLLGHDGSEIIFPDLPEPLCRRGFDPREFIFPLYLKGMSVIQIDAFIQRFVNEKMYQIDNRTNMFFAMKGNNGVLTGINQRGNYHAIAWINDQIHDMDGSIYGLGLFNPDCFYLVDDTPLLYMKSR